MLLLLRPRTRPISCRAGKRAGPRWTSTLLIITYDEHGGCFDHVPPPAAAPPDRVASSPFNFDRYGVRVPAVIISPFIKPQTILRPPASGPPFDHTSILATLRKRFALNAPLSLRDAAAPDLTSMASAWLTTPDNLGPDRVSALPVPDPAPRLQAMKQMPASDLQQSIVHINSQLPPPDVTVNEHVKRRRVLRSAPSAPAALPTPMTAGEAAELVRPASQRLRQMRPQ